MLKNIALLLEKVCTLGSVNFWPEHQNKAYFKYCIVTVILLKFASKFSIPWRSNRVDPVVSHHLWPSTADLADTWESRVFQWLWNCCRNSTPGTDGWQWVHFSQDAALWPCVRPSRHPMASASLPFLISQERDHLSLRTLLPFPIYPPLSPQEDGS